MLKGALRVQGRLGPQFQRFSVSAFSPSPPQRPDQLIDLIRDGLHIELSRRIVDEQAQQLDSVAVRARPVNGRGQIGEAHLAIRARRH